MAQRTANLIPVPVSVMAAPLSVMPAPLSVIPAKAGIQGGWKREARPLRPPQPPDSGFRGNDREEGGNDGEASGKGGMRMRRGRWTGSGRWLWPACRTERADSVAVALRRIRTGSNRPAPGSRGHGHAQARRGGVVDELEPRVVEGRTLSALSGTPMRGTLQEVLKLQRFADLVSRPPRKPSNRRFPGPHRIMKAPFGLPGGVRHGSREFWERRAPDVCGRPHGESR